MTEPVIVWADMESTGLKPGRPDQLLEVAALVTDYNLNILDEEGYHGIALHEKRDVVGIANDYVTEMHLKTGLWDKVKYGIPYYEMDRELLAYIKQFAPEPRQARLAGNSVRLDANFFDEFLPLTAEHLHYRILDVSSIAFEANAVRGIEVFHKKLEHSAMSDIRESIEELRYLRKALYRNDDT